MSTISITGDHFALIDARRGIKITTAANLRELATEIMLNSGDEMAFWCEAEARRCADIWRENVRRDAISEQLRSDPVYYQCDFEEGWTDAGIAEIERRMKLTGTDNSESPDSEKAGKEHN